MIANRFVFVASVLLMAWAALVWGNSTGMPGDRSGVSGGIDASCSTFGCHFDFDQNFGLGAVGISGLPTQWVPGTTYTIDVTVSDPNPDLDASAFGFQMTAVDSVGVQAGSFSPASGIEVQASEVGGHLLEHVQHSEPLAGDRTATFTFDWTAPATTDTGTVRFNVGGVAADGSGFAFGDYVYTDERFLLPFIESPDDDSVRSYSISDRGGLSLLTSSESEDFSVAYARIQPAAGSTTPSGIGIFGSRVNGVLVSETSVPASPLIEEGRIFARFNQPFNTGIAIANPNEQEVTIDFHFTDAGFISPISDFGSGTLTIPANQQISRFLSEAPFSLPNATDATLTFTSSLPVSVTALRGFVNARGDFLISALPVVDTTNTSLSALPIQIPHFASGGGWVTQVILVNPTDSQMIGNLVFYDEGAIADPEAGTIDFPGVQTPILLEGFSFPTSIYPYVINGKSAQVYRTTELDSNVRVGTVRIFPDFGHAVPVGQAVFTLFNGEGIIITEAAVQASESGTAFRMYGEVSGEPFAVGSIQSGVAILNMGFVNADITLELMEFDGTLIATSAPIPVPASGHKSFFIDEVLDVEFRGIVRITSTEEIAVTGLRGRTNERGEFLITTTPATDESGTPATDELLFPHLVEGGGFSFQTILFSGVAGQIAEGVMRLIGAVDGLPFQSTLQ